MRDRKQCKRCVCRELLEERWKYCPSVIDISLRSGAYMIPCAQIEDAGTRILTPESSEPPGHNPINKARFAGDS